MITIIPGVTHITLINIYINHGLHNAQLTKKAVILSYANNNTCRIKKCVFVFLGVVVWRATWVTTEPLDFGACIQADRPMSLSKVGILIECHIQ